MQIWGVKLDNIPVPTLFCSSQSIVSYMQTISQNTTVNSNFILGILEEGACETVQIASKFALLNILCRISLYYCIY
jgi:hypothetical protein